MPNEEEIKKLEEQKKAQLEAEAKAKAEAEAKAKLEAEAAAKAKAEEEAKKQAEQNAGNQAPAQEPQKAAHSVDDYMLKEDFDKKFTPFAEKIDALIGKATQLEADKKQLEDDKTKLQAEIEEAKKQKAELDEKIKGLQNKYENNSFGNVAHGGEVNPSAKSTKYVSYDEYMKSFGYQN